MSKRCSKCAKVRDICDFRTIQRVTKVSRQAACIDCENETRRRYRGKPPTRAAYRPWTPVEDSLLRAIYPTEGYKGTAAVMPGRDEYAIRRRATRLGVSQRTSKYSHPANKVESPVPVPAHEYSAADRAWIAHACAAAGLRQRVWRGGDCSEDGGVTRILAIDPGTHESGFCLYDAGKVITSGVMDNDDLLKIVADDNSDVLAIEKIVSYGSSVGQETFDTCVWIGRFLQAWGNPEDVMLIPRRKVKACVCGPGKWGDPDVRKALIARLGPQGTKKEPGATFGVKSHAWSALGVAYTAAESL